MKSAIRAVAKAVGSIVCLGVAAALLLNFGIGNRKVATIEKAGNVSYGIQDRFDQFVTNSISDALDGVLSIEKTYWLSDSDLIAPKPDPENYGSTTDAGQLQAVIDNAAKLLNGQDLLFDVNTPRYLDSAVKYYYDPTILTVTWKQLIGNTVYCISEIKIADASQFRRFMSDGEYLSGAKYLTTEMAESVNAVVAANGDYYAMRQLGMIINNGELLRDEGFWMDTCVIDKNGDMHFVEQGEIQDPLEMQQYINDNGIRFSLSFGPIMVEDGEMCKIKVEYPVGEVKIHNARAALCQMDELHYLLVVASIEPPYDKGILLTEFAEVLEGFGCKMAYNLDGGRSATLVMNNELQNYIFERLVSDIIYFATAIPNGG